MKIKLFLTLFLISIAIYTQNNTSGWIKHGNQWAEWGRSWSVPSHHNAVGFSCEDTKTQTINGCGFFKDQTIEKTLTVNGTASFDHVKTDQAVTVRGTATAKNSTLKNITVYGYLETYDTALAHVTLYTSEAMLQDSTITGNIVVHNKQENKLPKIELIDTKVLGNVEFKGKTGRVILSGNSTIAGKIINGQSIKN